MKRVEVSEGRFTERVSIRQMSPNLWQVQSKGAARGGLHESAGEALASVRRRAQQLSQRLGQEVVTIITWEWFTTVGEIAVRALVEPGGSGERS